MNRERENPCGMCGHYHQYEAGEVCGVCGHRMPIVFGEGAHRQSPYTSVPSFLRCSLTSSTSVATTAPRVIVDPRKHHPVYFALWKAAKSGKPSWESPWGPERPGWHIECSVISEKYLTFNFDIHGDGLDLIFPRHENEIAQSCTASLKSSVSYWMHNGHVTNNNEKMSKSLGNFFTIRQVHYKFELMDETLYLMVNLMDRFLAVH